MLFYDCVYTEWVLWKVRYYVYSGDMVIAQPGDHLIEAHEEDDVHQDA